MPSRFLRSEAALNAEADAVGALLDGGTLRLYAGKQPPGPESAPEGAVLLAELRFASRAFMKARGGAAHARKLSADKSARASGFATWFRASSSDGTAIFDGSAGPENADLLLAAETPAAGIAQPGNFIKLGGEVSLESFIYAATA